MCAAPLGDTASRQANVRAVVFHEKTRGPTRQPPEEIHRPFMSVRARPGAAATFIVAEQSLAALRDRHHLPVGRVLRPVDSPRLEPDVLSLMRAVPNLRRCLGRYRQDENTDE